MDAKTFIEWIGYGPRQKHPRLGNRVWDLMMARAARIDRGIYVPLKIPMLKYYVWPLEDLRVCYRCGRWTHKLKECREATTVDGDIICQRCGRYTHLVEGICREKTTIDGRTLQPLDWLDDSMIRSPANRERSKKMSLD